MSNIKFHRLTDWNYDIQGLKKHTNFEAGFLLEDDGCLFLKGKVIDSSGRAIFCSGDGREFGVERYQAWNPTVALAEFIEAIEFQTVELEPTYFQTPLLEMTLEVRGPVANPKVFATTISMSLRFSILEDYQWKDSGHISISMLCHKDRLLAFCRGLEADLLDLTPRRKLND